VEIEGFGINDGIKVGIGEFACRDLELMMG
jgi:hypothetical protein